MHFSRFLQREITGLKGRQSTEEQYGEIKTEAQHVGMNMLPRSVKEHFLIMEIKGSKLDG